jgi:hypothetical protein
MATASGETRNRLGELVQVRFAKLVVTRRPPTTRLV